MHANNSCLITTVNLFGPVWQLTEHIFMIRAANSYRLLCTGECHGIMASLWKDPQCDEHCCHNDSKAEGCIYWTTCCSLHFSKFNNGNLYISCIRGQTGEGWGFTRNEFTLFLFVFLELIPATHLLHLPVSCLPVCAALWNCLWVGSWRVVPSCFIYAFSSL